MEIYFDLINGMSFGIEYVSANEEAGVEYPCIIVDVAIFRCVLEFTR